MLELNARSFMGATVQLRHLINLIERIEDKKSQVGQIDKDSIFAPHIDQMIDALQVIGARSALATSRRLKEALNVQGNQLTYENVSVMLFDIESRFADHLDDIKLFVLHSDEAKLMYPADNLVESEGFAIHFPNASFEVEESAKCIALGRYTASVFHVMRSLEIGIKALARFLEIPDPVKPAERNWGSILEKISKKLDEKWPKKTRVESSEGARLEGLYATLDAVKNPWRNATMHVETIYAPHEAIHILRCAAFFLMKLKDHCDETILKDD